MSYLTTGIRVQKIPRGVPLSQEKIIRLNTLHYEERMFEAQILRKERVSQPVLDRALFATRAEWDQFKNRLAGVGNG